MIPAAGVLSLPAAGIAPVTVGLDTRWLVLLARLVLVELRRRRGALAGLWAIPGRRFAPVRFGAVIMVAAVSPPDVGVSSAVVIAPVPFARLARAAGVRVRLVRTGISGQSAVFADDVKIVREQVNPAQVCTNLGRKKFWEVILRNHRRGIWVFRLAVGPVTARFGRAVAVCPG